jgi:hypothetical protein
MRQLLLVNPQLCRAGIVWANRAAARRGQAVEGLPRQMGPSGS